MLRGDDHSPLGMVESTNEFRISIAGAQEKKRHSSGIKINGADL
jgi:hypothetical protein